MYSAFFWFLLLSISLPTITESKQCVHPAKLHPTLNRCYIKSQGQTTYTQAHATCHGTYGGSLPSIHGEFENQVTLGLVEQDALPFWIGLYRPDARFTDWKWDDGSVVDYLNLKTVDSENRNAIMLADGSWATESEFLIHSFFCFVNEHGWQCPNGWRKFDPTASCYQVSGDMPFDDAENYCQQHGGHLASIHSQEENDFIYELAAKECSGGDGDYYELLIGALFDGQQHKLLGWTDGSPVDYEAPYCQDRPSKNVIKMAVHNNKCGRCFAREWIGGADSSTPKARIFVCKAYPSSVRASSNSTST